MSSEKTNRKRTKNGKEAPEKSASEYYQLNTKAIEDLVTADESNSPVVPEAELRKYQRHSRIRIADWVKILFIKAWFPGSACYFFIWGLSPYVRSQLDLAFIISVAMGIITDLLTNNCIRFFEKEEGAFDHWMMIPEKRFSSYFLNILYAFILVYFVFTLYQALNLAIISAAGETEELPLGVGPILFGLFYMGFDMLFLKMKQVFRKMVNDAKMKLEEERKNR